MKKTFIPPLSFVVSLLLMFPFTALAASCSATNSATTYYSFDSDNSNDSSGGGNNGTGTSISYGSSYGKINDGALFTRSTPSYISVPSGTYSLFNGNTSYSINLWVKTSSWNGSLGQHTFFATNAGSGTFRTVTRIYWQNGWSFIKGDASDTSLTFTGDGTTPSDNTWYMVTATSDGTNIQLYLNASSIAGPTAITVTSPTNTNGYLGDYIDLGTGGALNGNMDEIGFYPCTLSSSQITDLYNSGSGTNPFSVASVSNSILSLVRAFWIW